jgi:hypothetical protein
VDAADCRECANRCIDMANEAVAETKQLSLLRWAHAWLRLAEDIEDDALLRIQIKDVAVLKRPMRRQTLRLIS